MVDIHEPTKFGQKLQFHKFELWVGTYLYATVQLLSEITFFLVIYFLYNNYSLVTSKCKVMNHVYQRKK